MSATVSLLEVVDSTPKTDRNREPALWRRVAPMVAAAFLLRLVIATLVFHWVADPIKGNENFGWEMGWTARSLALGHGFSSPFIPSTGPTALVPPLFPYILAGIFKIFGVYSKASAFTALTFESLLSALTCVPLYLSTRRSLGARAARWAAWAWVVYPFAVYFSAGLVWDFALSGFMFATCFWMVQGLDRRSSKLSWAGFGAVLGVAALGNPSTLLTLGVLLAMAVMRVRQRGQRWVARTAVCLLTLTAVMLPWTLRNATVLHVLCPVRDGFWLEAWAGNAGDSSTSNPEWAHPASNAAEMRLYRSMGETAYMDSKKVLTLDFVKTHPAWFVEVSVRRAVRFWTGFWSFGASYRKAEPLDLPNIFFCSAISILGLIGLIRWKRSGIPRLAEYAVVLLVFPLPYYVTHASMEYRQPIETVMVTLVVAGFALRRDRLSGETKAA